MLTAQPLARLLAIRPLLDATQRDQAGPRSALPFEHLASGQKVSGQVLSQADGISLVSIAGQTVAMRLPAPIAAGDRLRLSFAGNVPQPVFLLEPPEDGPGEAPLLSQTARMLSDIMQRVPDRTLPTLTPPAPLLEHPTPHPPALALALRTALTRSGLFYESHLADWVVGLDSLDGLMQEPQNRLTAAETPRAAAGMPAAPAPAGAGAAADAKPVNPLHTLLTQQLQVLESPHFVWKGELWPGQPLEWQLRRDEERAPNGDAAHPDAAGWTSRIRVTLPRLGAVTLHLRLDGTRAFSIRLAPEEPASEALLHAHASALRGRLAEAGCSVASLTVEHDAGA
jgi:hypothetical protein